jgi:hypothetical protein
MSKNLNFLSLPTAKILSKFEVIATHSNLTDFKFLSKILVNSVVTLLI